MKASSPPFLFQQILDVTKLLVGVLKLLRAMALFNVQQATEFEGVLILCIHMLDRDCI